jgi:hypothetical protein
VRDEVPSPIRRARGAPLNSWARPVPRRFLTCLVGILIATPAYAHGQDVLVSMFAQAASVAVVLFLLFAVPALRRYWPAGLLGCIIGVLVSWLLTADIPYMANITSITIVDICCPVVFAALSIVVANRVAAFRRRA